MVGQNQIGLHAGFVDEAAETDDIGNFAKASRTCRAGGAEKTGLASYSSNICGA